jgi:hypothetical protein
MLSFELPILSVSFPGLRVGIHLKIGNAVMICRLRAIPRSSMRKPRASIVTDGMKACVLAGLVRLSDLWWSRRALGVIFVI